MNADVVRAEVERIAASRRFATSERQCRLLRFAVEEVLAGRGGQIKEYLLGVDVFNRGKSFDPQTDPIVRTEVSRLRAKLKDYYETDGKDDPVQIEFPKRSYVPVFHQRAGVSREPKSEPASAPPIPPLRRAWRMATLGLMVALAVIGYLVVARGWKASATAGKALDEISSLAVLPFVNLSADPDSEYFSDGLTDELTERLAKVEGLRVVSRTSAFQFKNKAQDVRRIGAQLNVEFVLEGTVRRSGQHLRITTQLVKVADGYQVRSDIYDREFKDVFAVQAEIARHVVNTLRIRQVGARGNIQDPRFTSNLEAYSLYLEGLYHENQRSEWELHKAIELFRKAIAADSGYAPAYAEMADCYRLLTLSGSLAPKEVMPQAEQAAERAVELAPEFPHAHTALGAIRALYDWDWQEAARELDKALALDSGDASVLQDHALNYLIPQGHLRQALSEVERAQMLDPLSPSTAMSLGSVHFFAREHDRELAQYRRVLDLSPHFPGARVALGSAFERKAVFDQALGLLGENNSPADYGYRTALLGYAYGRAGKVAQARELLDELRDLSKHRYVSGCYLAMIHLALGNKAQALSWLERAYSDRCPMLAYLKVDPRFDPLRREPGFQALLAKIGLAG